MKPKNLDPLPYILAYVLGSLIGLAIMCVIGFYLITHGIVGLTMR